MKPLPIVDAEKQEEFRALRQTVLQGQELTGVERRVARRKTVLQLTSASQSPPCEIPEAAS